MQNKIIGSALALLFAVGIAFPIYAAGDCGCNTPTPTPVCTNTPTKTASAPTKTPTPKATKTPTQTPTKAPATPTQTPVAPTATLTPTVAATLTPTVAATLTATVVSPLPTPVQQVPPTMPAGGPDQTETPFVKPTEAEPTQTPTPTGTVKAPTALDVAIEPLTNGTLYVTTLPGAKVKIGLLPVQSEFTAGSSGLLIISLAPGETNVTSLGLTQKVTLVAGQVRYANFYASLLPLISK